MDAKQLKKICSLDIDIEKYFLGVFPVDKLPKHVPYPSCLIANTQPSSDPGEHWVAIYIDPVGKATHFCSYGKEPGPVICKWLNEHTNQWVATTRRIQGGISTTCGQYCLFYLHFRCRSMPVHVIISLFSSDFRENDCIVTAFINSLYDQNTRVFDARFM